MSPLNSDLLRSRFDREAKKADLRERSSRTKSAYSYSENSEVFPVRFTQYTRVAVLPSEALSEPILPGGVCNLPGDEIQCDDLGCFEALEDAEKIFNLGKWSSSVWAFKELFRETLAKMALIENDLFSDRKSHFFHCEKPVQAGKVGLRKSDGSPVYTKRMRCYDPVCPDCRDFDREKQAGELVRLTDLILRNHTGCSRVFRFQFTIPAEIESLPFSDKALQAKLLNGVQCVLRKAFGFSYRSNLAIFMNVHPVGDSDVMRDRWHVHVYVIPCEISEGRLTWSKVTWFDPKELQRMWSEVVGSHVIPPQISYVDVSKEGWKGRQGWQRFGRRADPRERRRRPHRRLGVFGGAAGLRDGPRRHQRRRRVAGHACGRHAVHRRRDPDGQSPVPLSVCEHRVSTVGRRAGRAVEQRRRRRDRGQSDGAVPHDGNADSFGLRNHPRIEPAAGDPLAGRLVLPRPDRRRERRAPVDSALGQRRPPAARHGDRTLCDGAASRQHLLHGVQRPGVDDHDQQRQSLGNDAVDGRHGQRGCNPRHSVSANGTTLVSSNWKNNDTSVAR